MIKSVLVRIYTTVLLLFFDHFSYFFRGGEMVTKFCSKKHILEIQIHHNRQISKQITGIMHEQRV